MTDTMHASDTTMEASGYSSNYTSIRYPFAGIIRDVQIRLPYYLSDWKLTFSYRIFAATVRIFFLNTIPALAYALDLYLRSEHYYGVNEALLASALGGSLRSHACGYHEDYSERCLKLSFSAEWRASLACER